MKYSITFLERDFTELQAAIFKDYTVERAAMLRCRTSITGEEVRFLVRSVHIFMGEDLNEATPYNVSVKSTAFMRVLKASDTANESIVFVHTHPGGETFFSTQDDRTETPFFRTVFTRVVRATHHGSLIFAEPDRFIGRVWLSDGTTVPLTDIRVVGDRWRFLRADHVAEPLPVFFDRQVRAFGPEIQHVLAQLHVGVVGAGGTGSPTIEQLTRLGIGTLTVIDDQTLDRSNINRVYNSGVADVNLPKVEIVRRTVEHIAVNTRLRTFQGRITQEAVAQELRSCDVIFGCTDDHWGRAILNELALRYLIPVIDMGVKVASEKGKITHIFSRVTMLQPGYACLHCRQRISPERARLEGLNPEELARLRGLGYAEGLEDPAPAVISFTSLTASLAVSEFLNRLIGFTGSSSASEILHSSIDRRTSTNRGEARSECTCQNSAIWGLGDTRLFLDMTWPEISMVAALSE